EESEGMPRLCGGGGGLSTRGGRRIIAAAMNDPIDPATVTMLWTEGAAAADSYAAFRGEFTLEKEATVNLLAFGASWFVVWIDGSFAAEGPTRGEVNDHEAVAASVKLAAGKHGIARHGHHTRGA